MDEAAPRFRLGWWWLPIIALLLIGIVAIVLALWLRTTGDLNAEMVRARSLGVAMDWRSLAVPLAAADHPARMRTLLETVKRANPAPSDDDWQAMREAFAAIPAGLAAWDSGVDAEVDGQIRDFPEQPAALIGGSDDPLRLLSQTHDIWESGEAAKDLLMRRSLRGRDDATALADLFARLVRLPAVVNPLWPEPQGLNMAEAWMTHVLRHRTRLDPSTTSRTALELADHLTVAMRQQIAVRPLLLSLALRVDAEPFFRAANIRLPSMMANPFSMRVLPRLGRRAVLARAIDSCAWIAVHGLPATIAGARQASPSRPMPGPLQMPSEMLSLTLECGSCLHCAGEQVPPVQAALLRLMRCVTGLRLLAADLEGAPWPIDPGDPAGGRLRPVLRDGMVIGAYGLGPDGIDGCGDRNKDWCWPLRASLGRLKASDPVKLP